MTAPEEQFTNELKSLVGEEEFAAMQVEVEEVDDPTAEKPEEESAPETPVTPDATTQPPESPEEAASEEGDEQAPSARLAYQLREERRLRHEAEQRAAADAQQRDAQVREILERFAAMQEAASAPQAPEPEFDDPEVQKLLDALSKRQSEALAPIQERFRNAEEQQEYQRQAQAYYQQQQQQVAAFVGEIEAAEKEYVASPEGKGYYERVEALKEYQRGVHSKAMKPFGADDKTIEQATAADIMGLYSFANHRAKAIGASPAEVVDAYIKATIPAAQETPSKPATPKKPSSAIAAAARATAEGASQPQGSTPASPAGPVTTDFIREVGPERALTPELLDKWAGEGNLIDNAMRLLTD